MFVCAKCTCVHFSPFFFSQAFGAAYGTAKSGTGIAAMSVMRPELIMKSIIPVVMAGIIAIYGLVVAVLIGNGRKWDLSFSRYFSGVPKWWLQLRGIISWFYPSCTNSLFAFFCTCSEQTLLFPGCSGL